MTPALASGGGADGHEWDLRASQNGAGNSAFHSPRAKRTACPAVGVGANGTWVRPPSRAVLETTPHSQAADALVVKGLMENQKVAGGLTTVSNRMLARCQLQVTRLYLPVARRAGLRSARRRVYGYCAFRTWREAGNGA